MKPQGSRKVTKSCGKSLCHTARPPRLERSEQAFLQADRGKAKTPQALKRAGERGSFKKRKKKKKKTLQVFFGIALALVHFKWNTVDTYSARLQRVARCAYRSGARLPIPQS